MSPQKALIVSDTHGRNENFVTVVKMHHPDFVVHCGDIEGSEEFLKNTCDCPLYMVPGNNDYFSQLPRELEFTAFGKKIWVTHGHNYYVSLSPEMIRQEAIVRGMDIVMYGHTHRPDVFQNSEIISVNPGSLSYPRQEGRKPSYVIMELDRKGELHFTVAYLG